MTKAEEKLLGIIDRQRDKIDKQQQQIEKLLGEISELHQQLFELLKHYHPNDRLPGYPFEPTPTPCSPTLPLQGPSDWPPAPPITCDSATYIGGPAVPKDYTYVGGSITVTPDPDHLPYGYDPKDPLNSRSVSLNAQESCKYKEWRTE